MPSVSVLRRAGRFSSIVATAPSRPSRTPDSSAGVSFAAGALMPSCGDGRRAGRACRARSWRTPGYPDWAPRAFALLSRYRRRRRIRRRARATESSRHPRRQSNAMRLEIICTGDEVLTGKIVNTNFSYMSQKLEDVGLAVQWETTVGDDRESLLLAFRLAGERADAVIVNGGLGPTVDDLSQELAAQAARVELRL